MWQKHVFLVIQCRTEIFNSALLSPSLLPSPASSLPPSLLQSFYPSLVKAPESYGVIFSHPAHLYHPTHMHAFTQSQTPSNPTHTQLEPVDLSVSKRSSSTSSSSSPPCSSASSPSSSRSSPSSPYSTASRASPRSSPSHPLPPTTPSLPYHTMVSPLLSSGSGVIQGSGVMVSPVVVPFPVLYPSPLLHQSIMVSQPSSDDDHHRRRAAKTGEASVTVLFHLNFNERDRLDQAFKHQRILQTQDACCFLLLLDF